MSLRLDSLTLRQISQVILRDTGRGRKGQEGAGRCYSVSPSSALAVETSFQVKVPGSRHALLLPSHLHPHFLSTCIFCRSLETCLSQHPTVYPVSSRITVYSHISTDHTKRVFPRFDSNMVIQCKMLEIVMAKRRARGGATELPKWDDPHFIYNGELIIHESDAWIYGDTVKILDRCYGLGYICKEELLNLRLVSKAAATLLQPASFEPSMSLSFDKTSTLS